MNAPILVTGGTGFIGSHAVERLLEQGLPVRCLVRRASSLEYLPASLVELCYGDLEEGTGLEEAVAGVGAVLHIAGITKATSTARFYGGNVTATANLLRACEQHGSPDCRFVYVSSLAAVGPSLDGQPLTEDATPRPLTHYGRSKLAAERAVLASPLAPRAVIVRPPVVFGPRDTDVCQVFRSVSNGVMMQIGRGESYFSLIYVKDLVDALKAAVCHARAPGEVFFAAAPEPVSWSEFGALAASLMGRRVKTIRLPAAVASAAGWGAELVSRFRAKPFILSRDKVREARCQYWICDTRKAREFLDFAPSRNLRDAVEETLVWYKNAKWLTF